MFSLSNLIKMLESSFIYVVAKYRERSDRLLVKTKSIFSFAEAGTGRERAVNFFSNDRSCKNNSMRFSFFSLSLSLFFSRFSSRRFFFVPVHLVVAAKVIDRSIDRSLSRSRIEMIPFLNNRNAILDFREMKYFSI